MHALYCGRALRDARRGDLLGRHRAHRLRSDRDGAQSAEWGAGGEPAPRPSLRHRVCRRPAAHRSRRPAARGRGGRTAGGFLESAGRSPLGYASITPQQSSAGPLDGGAILSSVFAGTRSFAGGLFTTVIFLYFLLASGDSFLRRLVEVLPRFASKRQAVDISQQIEHDISAYLITITLMNALVGAATAVVMWSTGVGDPVLWGTVAFILNYVPILGPAAAIFIFLFAGSLTIASTWQALLPAALYGAIHVIEGETVTPILLAKRFTLNPVFVVFSFVFWFWLWGVPGAILSAPILATIKLVCDRIRPLAALGHILAG